MVLSDKADPEINTYTQLQAEALFAVLQWAISDLQHKRAKHE